MDFLIIQSIGFLGLLCVVISFQKDRKSFTLIAQLFSGLFFAVHFFLLDAWTGAAMMGLAAVRAWSFYLRDEKKWIDHQALMYVFILLFWVAGLLTWQSYLSLLPPISATLECLALWNKKTRYLRWLFLSSRPTWAIYDFLVGSYSALATEAFIAISITIAIIRFDILKKKSGLSPSHFISR